MASIAWTVNSSVIAVPWTDFQVESTFWTARKLSRDNRELQVLSKKARTNKTISKTLKIDRRWKKDICVLWPQPSWLRLATSAQALLNGRNAQSHKTLKYQESHPPGEKSSMTRDKVSKMRTHSTQTTGKRNTNLHTWVSFLQTEHSHVRKFCKKFEVSQVFPHTPWRGRSS